MNGSDLTQLFSMRSVGAQLPFLLLAAAMFYGRPNRLRAMVALAAALGLASAIFVQGDAVNAFGWGLLLAITLLLLAHRLHRSGSIRFTQEERALVTGLLSGVSPSQARHFLDQGLWLSGKEGDVLTREEEPLSHLFCLASGEARVTSHGRQVGTCRAGDLIGEVTVISGDQASATVTLTGPARFWCAPAATLRPYVEAHDDVRQALEHGFAASLRTKLRASNQRIVEGAGSA
ncbi:MAG TPA: cyclic nucleotide-binding domain-containing protein [Allosphingosinicella sp.]|nr:cyclic nucleotide-binding domain-containing protein [Allosphingosinicella sp.]